MRRAFAALLCIHVAACGGANDDQMAADTAIPDQATIVPVVNQTPPANDAQPPAPPEPTAPPPQRAQAPATTQSPPTDYRAVGTEPFWAVSLRQSVATLERPDKEPRHIPVSRVTDAVAIRYMGEGFAMTVTPGPCSDGMSDAVWSDSVQIAFDEGTLKGCGGERDDMREEPH